MEYNEKSRLLSKAIQGEGKVPPGYVETNYIDTPEKAKAIASIIASEIAERLVLKIPKAKKSK